MLCLVATLALAQSPLATAWQAGRLHEAARLARAEHDALAGPLAAAARAASQLKALPEGEVLALAEAVVGLSATLGAPAPRLASDVAARARLAARASWKRRSFERTTGLVRAAQALAPGEADLAALEKVIASELTDEVTSCRVGSADPPPEQTEAMLRLLLTVTPPGSDPHAFAQKRLAELRK